MEEYLWQNRILFKDYSGHVKKVSEQLKTASLRAFREQQRPILFLRSASTDKDKLAREIAAQQGIDSGLVCAMSTLEPSPTFEHRATHIIRRERQSHVLYHDQIHPGFGWMHAHPDLVPL
jgi:hypothetical protein